MSEFRSDNGKYGAKRVARTATGYKGIINAPVHDDGMPIHGVMMEVNRGVGDDGEPYIQIDIAHLDGSAKDDISKAIFSALDAKGLVGKEVPSPHAASNFAIDIMHNSLSLALEALFECKLSTNTSLMPNAYKEFIAEQQKVRNGLEQSLMHAFGADCFIKQKEGAQPKNEMNRIQRLAEYFRNGVPEIREKFSGSNA